MRFTLEQAIQLSLENAESDMYDDRPVQSSQLHRWIGEAYMGASGRLQGSGIPVEYAEKDIRRAVAYLRLRSLIGAGIGADAQDMRERVREVASWHETGWIVATDEEPKVDWTPDAEEALSMIFGGRAVVIIPCTIGQIELPLG